MGVAVNSSTWSAAVVADMLGAVEPPVEEVVRLVDGQDLRAATASSSARGPCSGPAQQPVGDRA